uniref:Uncharacterized protein n=1 Tax=Avena sativa TaxID=4498 RepID=A0ACD6AG21_AVESA
MGSSSSSSSCHHLLLLTVIAAAVVLPLAAAEGMTEGEALVHLKKSFTNSSSVSSWLITNNDGGKSPCAPGSHEWHGVVCSRGKVTGLRLSGLQLGGTIDVEALSSFPDLRSVSFAGNNFTGPLPSFHRLTALKSMFLSDNKFSGNIHEEFFPNLNHLKKLWLDQNELSGPIPPSILEAKALIELHLERNDFSGELPPAPPPALKTLDLSENDLEGVVPEGFRRFDAGAFRGNQYLCYAPPTPGQPCKRPEATPPPGSSSSVHVMIMGLAVVLVSGVVLAVALCACCACCAGDNDPDNKGDTGEDTPPVYMVKQGPSATHRRSTSWLGRRSGSSAGGKHRRSSSAAKAEGGSSGGQGDLIIVNDCKGVFGMTDLMKAAAQVIGSGGGSAYKAVMAGGVAVVVKRARDMNRGTKDTFEAEMKRLGTIRHANLLTPLAYHYRRDEKLIVYEYIAKGSLLYVLHGDRGVDYAALDWPTRLKVAAGVARGAAFLHAVLGEHEAPHGNLKSSNVLLAPDFEPLLVDFGYSALVNYMQDTQTTTMTSLFARRAPECEAGHPVTAKADVYCLGIVLLELLTGKFPSQYLQNAKGGTDLVMWATTAHADGYEQDLFDPAIVTESKFALPDMKRLMEVAVECVEADLDRRPDMKQAAAKVEEVVAAALATVRERGDGEGGAASRSSQAAFVRNESMQQSTNAGESSAQFIFSLVICFLSSKYKCIYNILTKKIHSLKYTFFCQNILDPQGVSPFHFKKQNMEFVTTQNGSLLNLAFPNLACLLCHAGC